jgi:Flp pilus assembly protein TadD
MTGTEEAAVLFRDANAWLAQGQAGEAVALYRRVVALMPDAAPAWSNLGLALRDQGCLDEAETALRRALDLRPGAAEVHNNLSVVLRALGRVEESLAACDRALVLRPDYAEALCNRGTLLVEQDRVEEAEAVYRQALALCPGHDDTLNNLGNVLARQGRLGAALALYDQAIAARPDHADAHFNRGMLLLRQGRLAEGWRDYEWRRRRSGYRSRLAEAGNALVAGEDWRGEPLAGRTILLIAEQGLGDTLQFVRLAPLVAERGGRVVLWVPPSLVRLLASLTGVAAVVGFDERPPPCDCHALSMSLPLLLGIGDVAAIPAPIPYLEADAAATLSWRSILAAPSGRTVGLVWAGDPRPDDRAANLIDRRRSLPLTAFAPLAGVAGIRWISLQKGAAAGQAAHPPSGMVLADPMGGVADFADTAAIVANLDLVIGVDTAVIHLAGALGRPVWVLSRFDACWRWLEGREDSPWYPTLRLFRQTEPDDWAGVLARVAEALACGRF